MDEFFTKTKSDPCGTIFKVDILPQHRYHTILKGKAHHTDYPKLAAIEYEVIQHGEWFFPWHQVSKEGGESEIEGGS